MFLLLFSCSWRWPARKYPMLTCPIHVNLQFFPLLHSGFLFIIVLVVFFFFFFAMSASSALFSIVKHPFAVVERQLEGGRSAALKRETRSEARRKSSRKRKRKLKRNQSVKNAEQLRIQKKKEIWGHTRLFSWHCTRCLCAFPFLVVSTFTQPSFFFTSLFFSALHCRDQVVF